jgi:hypothetical protein
VIDLSAASRSAGGVRKAVSTRGCRRQTSFLLAEGSEFCVTHRLPVQVKISFRDHVPDHTRDSYAGRLWSVLCLYSLLVLVACGGPPPGTGDPSDRRLNQLASDPIFASLPPEAEKTGPMERTPAHHREPGFEPGAGTGHSSASRSQAASLPHRFSLTTRRKRPRAAGQAMATRTCSVTRLTGKSVFRRAGMGRSACWT